MKRIICICLIVVSLVLSLPAQAEGWNALYEITGCDSWVSLRQEPNTSAKRLAKVPKGAVVVSEHREAGKFRAVRYGEDSGYILAEYLTSHSLALKIASTDGTDLKKKASENSKAVKHIRKGGLVLFVSEGANDYYYVCCDGAFGYVRASDLKAAGQSQGILKRVVKCKNSIPMRFGPSTKYAVSKNIPLHQYIISYGSCGKGLDYVYYDGEYGFVQSKYLKRIV